LKTVQFGINNCELQSMWGGYRPPVDMGEDRATKIPR